MTNAIKKKKAITISFLKKKKWCPSLILQMFILFYFYFKGRGLLLEKK